MYKNAFPKELTELKNWVNWRLEPDPSGGKDKKVPISPKTGKKAFVNNPATWGTFEEAVQAMQKYNYNGIGFVFTEEIGIVAIDLDECLHADVLNDVAKDILAKAPKTFIEKSPFGNGLHVLVRGKLAGGGRRNDQLGIEIYATSRYFTMTGNRWIDCVDTIAEDNGIIDYVYKLACSRTKQATTTSTPDIASIATSVLVDDDFVSFSIFY